MKLTNSNANFSLSRDSKHYLYAGTIRNQVLSKEFNLPHIDLSTAFGINTKAELDATCEFSRLAILPEYQGAKGASLLIGAVAEHSIKRGLRHLVYCSSARKMGIFNAIAQRKGLHVQLDTHEFQYADIAHATFQAALVRMNTGVDAQSRLIRKVVL